MSGRHIITVCRLALFGATMSELKTTYKSRDPFYESQKWRSLRQRILRRDKYIDQYRLRDGVTIEATVVHHILPREDFPQYQFCPWNLISVNEETHRKVLHELFTHKLTKRGRLLMQETAHINGVKLRMLTMVIGMPGTGKSTYVKKHLKGGLVYELDAIACAFRLTVPHKEEIHAGARRMAAQLREGFLQIAPRYSDNIFVVRTCPDIEEMSQTMPDKLVVCTKKYADRPYVYDPKEYQQRIDDAIEWAKKNGVPIEINNE